MTACLRPGPPSSGPGQSHAQAGTKGPGGRSAPAEVRPHAVRGFGPTGGSPERAGGKNGESIGNALVEHPVPCMVSVTGSIPVGRSIAAKPASGRWSWAAQL
ncbi:aldehyde dehydrogenase family protein [Streptomyces himalayensis]|uniref:aldehyde dehydrogenase family protein n=1 Tax=Streptomyces himalayensis TaxID=2820085 RepID=UPI0035A8B65B